MLNADAYVFVDIQRFEELGREDGLRDGIQAGYLEGRIAGTGHGFDMTREAGFYGGAADMWIRAAQKGLFDTSDRYVSITNEKRRQ